MILWIDLLIGITLALSGILLGLKGYTVWSITFSLGAILTAVWIIYISKRG